MKLSLKLRERLESPIVSSTTLTPSTPSTLSSPTPHLVIDYRESSLIDLLKRHGVAHSTRNLDVGDIVIEMSDCSELLVVIERKTLNDLASSIRDGRYREQKARIMATKAPRRIYLIETSAIYQFSLDTIESALLNTLIRDGLGIYQTRSLEHTYQTISSIFKKTCEFVELLRHGQEEINYVKNV